MRRLIPDSLAGRTILVLVVGLALSHVAATAIYLDDRNDALAVVGDIQTAERVASITRLVAETEPGDRTRLISAIDSPALRISLTRESGVSATVAQATRSSILKQALAALLNGGIASVIRVERKDAATPLLRRLVNFSGPLDLLHDHLAAAKDQFGAVIRVSLRLPDASWLNFTTAVASPGSAWSQRFAISELAMVIAVLGFSIWALRYFSAPFVLFANAADRLGRDVAAPPLRVAGTKEIRRAARAFNRMQARLQRFVEDRTQMVAAISHDLRTPITRMRLRAEFIEDEEERRKMLADLDDMERMVKDVVEFARDEAAMETPETVDLSALLVRVVDDLTDAGWRIDMDRHARAAYKCRPTALRRAFTNLIENGAKYGQRAHVRMQANERELVVTIEDDGPGIPEDARESVFRPFYRLEDSRSRDTGGVGLGLAVARTIIRAHGGDVLLRNRSGGGLRAEVQLPV